MKFPDKLTSIGQVEHYTTGEATERFVVIAETRKEADAIQASLANVALMALQSETAMDPEDARVLIDFMRVDQFQQSRITVYPEQAERLARLIRQGGSSVMPEIFKNQFKPRENDKADQIDDEELTRNSIAVANSMNIEVAARSFRKELDDSLLEDL